MIIRRRKTKKKKGAVKIDPTVTVTQHTDYNRIRDHGCV